MSNTLFLRLQGPVQSWGNRDFGSVRGTDLFPTKSAIVGILACAMGAKSDRAFVEISDAVKIGVRADKPGTVMVDYQTVAGHIAGDGKPKRDHIEQVFKSYLADASFLVAVMSADKIRIGTLAYFLESPTWPYFLGRKSYVPATPVFAGVGDYQTIGEALLSHQWPEGAVSLRARIECAGDNPGAVRVSDNILSRHNRQFAPRYYYEATIGA